MGLPDTHLKARPGGNTREAPRRIQRTREASREEAIVSTQQFFATVDERNRNNSTGVYGREDSDVPGASPSVVTTTPVVLDVELIQTSSPRIILPNGSQP